ncbi:lipase maturation factor family protein [Hyalangium rubrum]|uniref:Lipase maturation factor 2 n=1 Tax=Hyalangium rubrum TaxID=3103134 RepID=A0ABU5HFU7_9BACT|nr:lipase maturation factor family protein [Hyalangium sp. s54d21]MDY7232343.1 lipase maturation factor family protein [Hyalangium sp. s54d21]
MRLGLTSRPLVLYDGDCGFCRRWVTRWQAHTGGRVRFLPARPAVRWLLGIRRKEARRAMQLIEPSGAVFQGAEAAFRMLLSSPRRGTRWAARLGLLPGVRSVTRGVYRVIASHRVQASRLDRLLYGRRYVGPADYRQVRWLFLRLLGGTFLIAFTSLGRQVPGLFGSRGIRPVKDWVGSEQLQTLGKERFHLLPSVFWLDASDAALVRGARAGQLLSLALLFNVAPRTSAALLWALYLSYVSVGREFLSFQWDALLLEMGLLAVVTAPGGVRPGLGRESPSALDVALFRALLLRLYLGSGLSKLQSGDRTWRELTACNHYYETAPLPTRGGWYAHQLPQRLQKASTAATLVMETAVPVLTLLPRRPRQLAFALFGLLQGTIFATGNYGFFNLQSLVLGLWLLDDEALARVLPLGPVEPARPRPLWRTLLGGAAALPLLVLGARELLARFGLPRQLPRALERLEEWARPLRAVNSYGLFSVMTVERPEISIEGSEDGEHWREYPFRYKVSRLDQAPRQVAPHQPRLDWQMWFAALGSPPSWFLSLLVRLLEGSPEVLALLERNPFPERPPRYVRAVLYDYRMTDPATRRSTGAWWKREQLGLYVPPVALGLGARTHRGPLLQWNVEA